MATNPVTLDFSKAQPIQTAPPATSAQSSDDGGSGSSGVTLDFSKAQPLSGTSANQPTQQPTAIPNALNIKSTDNPALKFAKGTDAIGAGIGEGLLDTLNGGASILHVPHATLGQRAQQLQQDNAGNPTLNAVGNGAESIAEFFTGDEALKGLALSERLAKATKLAKLLEDSPRLKQAFDIGATALRQGSVQGALSTLSSGNAKEGATEGALTGAASALLGTGGAAIKAIRDATDAQSVQAPLQNALRGIVADVANAEGINPADSPSIRDLAHNAANAVEAKAKMMYQTLDDISGGRAQRFRDALRNVNDKLSDIVGLDDDKEAELTAKKAEIEAAHQKMLSDLQAAGHDPNLLAQASDAWKKQSSLSDLGNAVRQSASGLRPELATSAKATPETLNPKPLFTKLNRLYDSGRLQTAIGPDNAANLLRYVDTAFIQAQKIADNAKWVTALKKTGLGTTGLATAGIVAGGARHFAHELLGGAE